MRRNSGRHRHDLEAIARRVMIERGLLPDFSAAALEEVARFRGAAADGDVGARDLRDLLWCSIDNDDSRDLDQLTVAEPLPGGTVKARVAVARKLLTLVFYGLRDGEVRCLEAIQAA